MENNGGFIQMAMDLSLDPSVNMFVMHQRTMGSSWMFTAREQQMLTKVSTFTYEHLRANDRIHPTDKRLPSHLVNGHPCVFHGVGLRDMDQVLTLYR